MSTEAAPPDPTQFGAALNGLPISGILREALLDWANEHGYSELRLKTMTREFEVATIDLIDADLAVELEIVPTDDADYVLRHVVYLANRPLRVIGSRAVPPYAA